MGESKKKHESERLVPETKLRNYSQDITDISNETSEYNRRLFAKRASIKNKLIELESNVRQTNRKIKESAKELAYGIFLFLVPLLLLIFAPDGADALGLLWVSIVGGIFLLITIILFLKTSFYIIKSNYLNYKINKLSEE